MEGCMGDRPRSAGLDVLEEREKLATWMKSAAHVTHIVIEGHRK
jgi:hypothetical protein